jgi:stage II sporulation protein D
MSLAALLLVVQAQLPVAPVIAAPRTLEVVVLSKQSPRWLEVLSGDCRVKDLVGLDEPVALLSAQRGLVRACGAQPPRPAGPLPAPSRRGRRPRPPPLPPRTCVEAAALELTCTSTAVVRGPAIPERALGSRLRLRTERGAGLRVVTTVPREAYVAGVVQAELAEAPLEAARTQAVLARSFALRAAREPRHDDAALCDLTHCQVFQGLRAPIPPRPGTRPRVLVDRAGVLADVFFHSTCGGRTVSPRDVWGIKSGPEVVGVDDVDAEGRAWCRRSPHYRWVHEVSEDALVVALRPLVTRPLEPASVVLEATNKQSTRWILGDREGTEAVDGEAVHLELSRALGFSAVKSSNFVVKRAGTTLRLSGSGLGHRVGLCQMGTLARARAGQSSREILLAYFPRLDVARVVDE